MTDKRTSFGSGATVGDGNAVTIANSDDNGDSALALVNPAAVHVYDDDLLPAGTSWACLVGTTATNPCALGYSDTAGTTFRARMYIYLTAYGSVGQMGIHCRANPDAQSYKLYINATGKMEVQTNSTTLYTGSPTMPLNTWLRLELWGTNMNSSSSVLQGAIYTEHGTTALDSYNSGTITTTANIGAIRYGRFGGTHATAYSIAWLAGDVGNATPYGPAVTNLPPTCNAGADQSNIEAYSTVTVTGTDSDSDGTIASRTWRVISTTNGAATPTLSGSGNSRTFKAPGTLLGTVITLGYQVQDNGGLDSTEDTMTVTVLPATERIAVAGSLVPYEVRIA